MWYISFFVVAAHHMLSHDLYTCMLEVPVEVIVMRIIIYVKAMPIKSFSEEVHHFQGLFTVSKYVATYIATYNSDIIVIYMHVY